ncbi:MAG: putative baseplate assembly protein [Nitrospira sp.]|nr:putative baseplate assembly protein [Nitrospira sp.]
MSGQAPLIDQRTASHIAMQVRKLVKTYTVGYPEANPAEGVGAALVGIVGRFSEIILQRLNKVPEKNLLAFLDLLGASLTPPQSARVPLTFSLAQGSIIDGVVPQGTQVSAPPAEGKQEPVVFETERELVVTAAQLTSILVREPAYDRYDDFSGLSSAPVDAGVPAFRGSRPIEHLTYLGQDEALGVSNLRTVTLSIVLDQAIENPDPRKIIWESWDGAAGIPLSPNDGTADLTKSGEIVFTTGLSSFSRQVVGEKAGRWIRGRLVTPISPAGQAQSGMVRADQLPRVTSMTMQTTVGKDGLAVDHAFAGSAPVDTTKDFYPFGEKPRFSDAWYIAGKDAFSQAGAKVTLTITLTDPASGIPAPRTDGNPKLVWECWDGTTWVGIGTATAGSETTTTTFSDTTRGFTQSGIVALTLPTTVRPTTVNGAENYWLRVRLASGNYGTEARFELIDPTHPEKGYKLIPATFAPPSIGRLTVGYSLTTVATPLSAVVTYNDFSYEDVTGKAFAPFRPVQDSHPTLYFGLTRPPARATFPNNTLSLYVRIRETIYGATPDNPSPASSPRLVWQMKDGQGWQKIGVSDDTQDLTRPGLVEFLPPAGLVPGSAFGVERYWLRAQWESGDYRFLPKIRQVALNTVMASQLISVTSEILGSGNAAENQRFSTAHAPVLAGQRLEVREPEMATAAERATLEREEGADAVSVLLDPTGCPEEIWVRWHEVPDFYGSGPRDRHYVMNHSTGEIRFGNGVNGLAPPTGIGNIRMAWYQTGGGAAGNRPAGTIVQLNRTIPYVDKVTNLDASSGGAEAELPADLLNRAPRAIRHRGRAVTLEDYEDLAVLASPDVARAKCVPLRDLIDDPLDTKPRAPGAVSVVIVPCSSEAKPLPSLELTTRVQSYLERYSVPTATVAVVGPLYVKVNITVEIALVSLDRAGPVEQAAQDRLAAFLHPLVGGQDGNGWAFGRVPSKSDIYATLGTISGLDHVRSLRLELVVDLPDVDLQAVTATGRFLVYSGLHRIASISEET